MTKYEFRNSWLLKHQKYDEKYNNSRKGEM